MPLSPLALKSLDLKSTPVVNNAFGRSLLQRDEWFDVSYLFILWNAFATHPKSIRNLSASDHSVIFPASKTPLGVSNQRPSLSMIRNTTKKKSHRVYNWMLDYAGISSSNTDITNITEAFLLSIASPFLWGKNDRGWKMSFDFFTREEGIKTAPISSIYEGKYAGAGGFGLSDSYKAMLAANNLNWTDIQECARNMVDTHSASAFISDVFLSKSYKGVDGASNALHLLIDDFIVEWRIITCDPIHPVASNAQKSRICLTDGSSLNYGLRACLLHNIAERCEYSIKMPSLAMNANDPSASQRVAISYNKRLHQKLKFLPAILKGVLLNKGAENTPQAWFEILNDQVQKNNEFFYHILEPIMQVRDEPLASVDGLEKILGDIQTQISDSYLGLETLSSGFNTLLKNTIPESFLCFKKHEDKLIGEREKAQASMCI